MTTTWRVERWSGRSADTPRVMRFETRERAEARFDKLSKDMRQGSLDLIAPDGRTLKAVRAPTLRTRW